MTSSILGKGYDPSQFWREEIVDDAVYITYLKRIPLHMRPWTWTENATYTLWETQSIRCISAGTLPRLVDAFCKANGELDVSYTNMFLYMFRIFATVEEVLNLILDRIKYWKSIEKRNRPQASVFKKAYIKVLYMWLKDYPEDFKQSPDYTSLNKLILFTDEFAIDSHIKVKAEELIHYFQTEVTTVEQPVEQDSKESIISHEKGVSSMNTLIYKRPKLIAEQLTYKDAELLIQLVPYHCLGFQRASEDQQAKLLTVPAVTSFFNDVSNVVISSVLMAESKPFQRTKVIIHWIMVAQNLRMLNNFSSLNAVIKALQSSSVIRLSKSWAAISKKVAAEYKEITDMFSLHDNVFNSRTTLMEEATSGSFTNSKGELVRKFPKGVTMQGTIPFLDLFLSDLIDVDAAMPNKTPTGLINFDKHRQEFEILTQLQLLKKSATLYKFNKAPGFWKWFHSICRRSEAESLQMSLLLEP